MNRTEKMDAILYCTGGIHFVSGNVKFLIKTSTIFFVSGNLCNIIIASGFYKSIDKPG